ncbi:minor capsid protein [Nonomuraea lactucae]|uniref:minor capsid protein n=1 Tax=Nonomuraea lactucae TaxID=2249762 RepID=UPI0019657388|nr:minor capsid protein [Nonomuraea lactucae]
MPQRARLKLNTQQIKARQRAGAVKGLKVAAEHLLQVSRELVPHEEGTLERSGTVSADEANLRAAVSYDTPYAVRQHEELTWKHDPGRQAKYLEEPLNTEAATMMELVAAQIRRSLRS